MFSRKAVVVAGLASWLLAGVAQAEGDPVPVMQAPDGQGQAVQAYPQQQTQQGGQQGVPVTEQSRQAGRGIEYGGHLIVPIFTDATGTSPGIGLQGRLGWEFPAGFTLELNIGGMLNPVSDDDLDISGNLNNVWVGGGLRYAFMNPSALVPFVGVGVQLNFWERQSDGVAVDKERQATFSVDALAGFAYEISPQIAIEAGLQVNYGTRGDVFPEGQATPLWLTPFLGGTLYY